MSERDEIEARYQAGVPLFDYDQSAPLGIDESQPVNEGHHTVQDLRFPSPKGGQVIATVVTPQGPGPFAALILVDADDRLDWLFLARDYADNLDVLSIMIDPPLARLPEVDRPALGFALTERDREEQIQFVIDLRRTIDLLEARPDVDPGRIGVRAWGVGAEYGALLAGVEDRVGAYQLVDLVGGPVTFLSSTDPTDPDTKAFWDLAAEQREAWLRAMAPIEPVYNIGHASPAYLLFQLEDREFFRDNSRLLLDVASEPKDVRWLPHPHGPSDDCDAAAWFAPHLGLPDVPLNPSCP